MIIYDGLSYILFHSKDGYPFQIESLNSICLGLVELDSLPVIRILFAHLPRLLSDLVTPLIEARPATEILGSCETLHELEDVAHALAPDLILISQGDEETEESVASFVKKLPRTTVISLSHDGQKAYVYRSRVLWETLTDFSVQSLIEDALGRG